MKYLEDQELQWYNNNLFRTEEDQNIRHAEKRNEESDNNNDNDLGYQVFCSLYLCGFL